VDHQLAEKISHSMSSTMTCPATVEALAQPATLSVVPVFNERDNAAEMVRRLSVTLSDVPWEVIFVNDDSTDGTREIVLDLARSDIRVRLLHRVGRRGLASAVVEGIQSTTAPYVAVIDGDLQHDERLLPAMLARLNNGWGPTILGLLSFSAVCSIGMV
jgi:dolichol-phosphate mannosyltransferase